MPLPFTRYGDSAEQRKALRLRTAYIRVDVMMQVR
jgi:hypothetical protein